MYSIPEGNAAALPAINVKSSHAKGWQVNLESDFKGALTNAALLRAKR